MLSLVTELLLFVAFTCRPYNLQNNVKESIKQKQIYLRISVYNPDAKEHRVSWSVPHPALWTRIDAAEVQPSICQESARRDPLSTSRNMNDNRNNNCE
jgi:hypothetical protein